MDRVEQWVNGMIQAHQEALAATMEQRIDAKISAEPDGGLAYFFENIQDRATFVRNYVATMTLRRRA